MLSGKTIKLRCPCHSGRTV